MTRGALGAGMCAAAAVQPLAFGHCEGCVSCADRSGWRQVALPPLSCAVACAVATDALLIIVATGASFTAAFQLCSGVIFFSNQHFPAGVCHCGLQHLSGVPAIFSRPYGNSQC